MPDREMPSLTQKTARILEQANQSYDGLKLGVFIRIEANFNSAALV